VQLRKKCDTRADSEFSPQYSTGGNAGEAADSTASVSETHDPPPRKKFKSLSQRISEHRSVITLLKCD